MICVYFCINFIRLCVDGYLWIERINWHWYVNNLHTKWNSHMQNSKQNQRSLFVLFLVPSSFDQCVNIMCVCVFFFFFNFEFLVLISLEWISSKRKKISFFSFAVFFIKDNANSKCRVFSFGAHFHLSTSQ